MKRAAIIILVGLGIFALAIISPTIVLNWLYGPLQMAWWHYPIIWLAVGIPQALARAHNKL